MSAAALERVITAMAGPDARPRPDQVRAVEALVEFTVAARSPARSAAAIWSRIRASSGETTSVGPPPAARSAEVAAQ